MSKTGYQFWKRKHCALQVLTISTFTVIGLTNAHSCTALTLKQSKYQTEIAICAVRDGTQQEPMDASALLDLSADQLQLPAIAPRDLVTDAQLRTCQCVIDNYSHLAAYGTALRRRIEMPDCELLDSMSSEQLTYATHRAQAVGATPARFLKGVYSDLYGNLQYVLLRTLHHSDPLLLAYDVLITADNATGIFALASMEQLLAEWTNGYFAATHANKALATRKLRRTE